MGSNYQKTTKLSFLTINDGSMHESIQIILSKDLENYDKLQHLTSGCSVEIHGKFIKSPAKGQEFEILATEAKILGMVENPESYPTPMKRHTVEHLRTHAHLRQKNKHA